MSAEAVQSAAAEPGVSRPWSTRWWTRPPSWSNEHQVDELVDAGDAEFELDMVHQGQIGSALLFAGLAAMGLLLALWATPTPVVFAGWVIAAGSGLAAARQVAGGEAR
jgi:hypothetical protein